MSEAERAHKPQAIELDAPIMVPPVQRPMKSVWIIDGQIKPGALAMTDPAEPLRAMDRQGVDVHVIFPSLFLALAPETPAVELALKNMDETIKDIAWARRHGAVGIHMRGLEGNRPIDDPDFYPVYRVAQELDMPICVHIGNAMSAPTILSFTAIATSEISTVFPTLRFGFFEVGSSWLTYVVTQAHKVRDERDRKTFTQSVLRERNLYVTCEEHEELPLILQYAGDGHLVLGSDYGHPGDVDDSIMVQQKLRARPDLTATQKQRILSDNAEALFGPG